MRDDLAFAVWSRERQRRIEDVLDRALAAERELPLVAAMRYATLGGGKRMRPLLAYAAGEFAGADPDVVDAPAAAVEMIHAYSLVHDDLPCMDDDTLRRGKPTCHVQHGEAMALLAGDALQATAFALLARARMPDAGHACARLAEAAGPAGMAGGQAVDLVAVGRALALSELEAMHRRKTGALIGAAVELGAMCAGTLPEAEAKALRAYAAAAGLAFQVIDDILDAEGTAQTLGKTAGKDAASGKPTYATLLGLVAARQRAEALRAEAHAALAGYGARGRRLSELADWIVLRQH